MNTPEQIHAHIVIPADCLPLVTELVARLGGNVAGTDEGWAATQPVPEIERGGKTLRTSPRRPQQKVKLGGWEGKIWMSDDFNAPMEEFEDYM